MFNSLKLDNGMNVASYLMSDVKSVAIQVLLFGGPITEDIENNGITHLVEHAVLGGTKSYPNKNSLASKLEEYGVSYGGFTGSEYMGFHFDTPYTNLVPTLKIIKEILYDPLFNTHFLEKEKKVVFEEILDDLNDPLNPFYKTIREIRYKKNNHPLSLDILGEKDNIIHYDKQKFIDRYQNQFVPSNMFLALTGYIEEGFGNHSLEHTLNEIFNTTYIKDRVVRPNFSADDFSDTKYIVKNINSLSNVNVHISFPGISMNHNHKTKAAATLLSTILTGLRTSRLFQKIREERGLVYDISSASNIKWRLGTFDLVFQSDSENIPTIFEVIRQELEDLKSNGPSKEEFEHAVSYLNNRTLLSFSSTWSINSWIVEDMLYQHEVLFPEERVAIRQSLKADDLKELTKSIFNYKKANVVVMGNIKDYNDKIVKSIELLLE